MVVNMDTLLQVAVLHIFLEHGTVCHGPCLLCVQSKWSLICTLGGYLRCVLRE